MFCFQEKFFECKCSRCTDRNDRENFEDALICQKCAEAGFLNPPEWKCTKCDKVTLKPEAETILFTANQDAVKLLNNPCKLDFHNFFLFITLKSHILQHYGEWNSTKHIWLIMEKFYIRKICAC